MRSLKHVTISVSTLRNAIYFVLSGGPVPKIIFLKMPYLIFRYLPRTYLVPTVWKAAIS